MDYRLISRTGVIVDGVALGQLIDETEAPVFQQTLNTGGVGVSAMYSESGM